MSKRGGLRNLIRQVSSHLREGGGGGGEGGLGVPYSALSQRIRKGKNRWKRGATPFGYVNHSLKKGKRPESDFLKWKEKGERGTGNN